jgi:tryptophanyl-tRNA synthetase
MSKLLSDKTVASFGDGPGVYKREIDKLGHVKLHDPFDGAPYCEETSHGRARFMDLSIPQYGILQYDWIISLEVAEHIPEKYEAVYLDNIFRHAKEGIILSWTVPGQAGISHINNKPIGYISKVMRENGFQRDAGKTMKLQASASLSWIKINIMVYIRNK